MGSRYGGLKQLDPMGPNGEVVLDYSVYDAIRAGFGKVVFIIRRDFEDIFKEKVGSRFAGKIEVDYAFQSLDDLPEGFSVPEGREKPWGTAHALRAARHVVKEPFAVVNADDFYGADAFVQAAKFLTSTTDEPGKAHYGMIDRTQGLGGNLHFHELTEFRNPDALLLKVGENGTIDSLSDVTTNTALFLGKTGAMDTTTFVRHGTSDDANSGHGNRSYLLMRER